MLHIHTYYVYILMCISVLIFSKVEEVLAPGAGVEIWPWWRGFWKLYTPVSGQSCFHSWV